MGHRLRVPCPKDSLCADNAELGITFAFDLEIVWRFLAHLPDWRAFGQVPINSIDLTIAIGSSVIQIPTIQSSPAYAWLTVFQLVRWYRFILEVPRMRPLILTVFGNYSGLMNMTMFLLIMNGIAALAAVQLLRGDTTDHNNMNFSQIWVAFLAMYQVCRAVLVASCLLISLRMVRYCHRKIGRMSCTARLRRRRL